MLKTHINKYIETRVISHCEIIKKLHNVNCCSSEELIASLNTNISKSTVYKYIEELKQILDEKIFIKKNTVYFFPEKALKENLALIYQTSAFLDLLSHYLVPSTQSFNQYIQSKYLSRAKAYQLKKKVQLFLKDCGCDDLKNNTVKNILKKMLLIARLELDFGQKILSKKYDAQHHYYIIKNFINTLPHNLIFGEKKELFHHLIFQTLILNDEIKNENYFDYLFSEKVKTESLYQMFEIFVRKHTIFAVNEKSHMCFFIFFLLESFSPKKTYFNQNYQEKEKMLFKGIEAIIPYSLKNNLLFYHICTDVFKYLHFPSFFKLIIEDEDNEKRDCKPDLFNHVFQIFTKFASDTSLNIDVIRFFCFKLEELILLTEHTKIYIFSYSYTEYLSLLYYLKKFCKVNIFLSDVWFYNLEELKLIQCNNSFIVTSIKNADVFNNWKNVCYIEFPFTEKKIQSLNQFLFKHILLN
ncbi:hypothetical protein [Enterococcus gallinarum]|uniref:hypothetical protein n=1 Tax=Enterococcus gallinarum TaxID=1353 RepID=UPI001AD7419C|nr:hypothetical protein [Enterococcus gallinarum]MBO6419994.1 hypothetical protein [Enterococcus gallinarum]MBO6422991.1 hypothetical protein [Enterococcus gallinarum]